MLMPMPMPSLVDVLRPPFGSGGEVASLIACENDEDREGVGKV